MTRPTKKRKRDRCSRVGNASTAHKTCHWSTPSEKNARSRARLCGLYRDDRVILMYRRAHLCMNVANIAQVRLIDTLKNQSELTQMADFEGENVEESVTREGGGSHGSFWWERSRQMFLR